MMKPRFTAGLTLAAIQQISRVPFARTKVFHALVLASSAALTLNAANTDVWTGAQSANWDNAAPNWLVNGKSGAYSDGDAVTFDDTGANQDVILANPFSPSSVLVSGDYSSYIFEGPGSIAGSTGITKRGTGSLKINSANTFTGPVAIQAGLVILGNPSALGDTTGGTVISNGATLDFNGQYVKNEAISVSGPGVDGMGAIITSGGDTYGDSGMGGANITLTGDTTFRFDHRWDLGSSAILSTGGKSYSLSMAGGAYHELAGLTVDPKLADINVLEGTLGIKGMTTLGDPNRTLTVSPSAQLIFWGGSGYAKKYHVQGAIVFRYDGPIFDANITFDDQSTFASINATKTFTKPMVLNGQVHFQIGDSVTSITNTISGTGGFYYDNYTSGTLLLSGRNTYTGDTYILQGAGLFILDGNNAGGGTLSGGQGTTIAGRGTNAGPLILDGVLQPGRAGAAGTFTTGALTINSSGSVVMEVSTNTAVGGGTNDLLVVNGDLTIADNLAPFNVNPISGKLAAGNYRLVNYTGKLVGAFNTNISSSATLTVTLNTNTPHQIILAVAGTPSNLRWSNIETVTWDVNTTAGWFNIGTGKTTTYNQFDNVLFDDAPGVQNYVWLAGQLTPTSVTVNSSETAFTFNGSGSISGGASLTKEGSSTLALETPNDFSGPINLLGGTLVGSAQNSLGSKSQGTITISNATLDIHGNYLGDKPVVASGDGAPGSAGAIVNSAGDVYGLTSSLTLAGDTTFAGNRWDISGGSTLSTGGKPYNLTLAGGYRELSGVKIDPALGNISVKGTIGLKDLVSLGNPAASLTAESGAQINYWSGNGPSKVFHIMSGASVQYLSGNVFSNSFVFEDGGTFVMIWGTRAFNGPVTFNGLAHFVIGDGDCTFTNVFSGPGGFYWDNYNHSMILMAANTYQGPTIIGNGLTLKLSGAGSISASTNIVFGGSDVSSVRIDASGRTDKTLTLAANQTLLGAGGVNGKLVIAPGATLAPGTNTSTGGISATDAIALNGTTALKIDLATPANDVVSAGGTLTYGGVLNVAVLNGTPSVGSSFKLFSASSYAGSFTAVSPAPADGLYWDTSRLTVDGTLSVTDTPTAPVAARINASALLNGSLVLKGATTNGIGGGNYVILTQTNVAAPIADWIPVATNTFDAAGSFSNNITVDSALPKTFYIIQSK